VTWQGKTTWTWSCIW